MKKVNLLRAAVATMFIGLTSNASATVCGIYEWNTNGCSLKGVEDTVLNNMGLGIENCEEHDRCYRILGNTRKECDLQFRKAVAKHCRQEIGIFNFAACETHARTAYIFVRNGGSLPYSNEQNRAVIWMSKMADDISTGPCTRALNIPAWTTTGNVSAQWRVVSQMYQAKGIELGMSNATLLNGLHDFIKLSGGDTHDDWRFTLASYLQKGQIQDLESIVTQPNFKDLVESGQISLPNRLALTLDSGGQEPIASPEGSYAAVLNVSM